MPLPQGWLCTLHNPILSARISCAARCLCWPPFAIAVVSRWKLRRSLACYPLRVCCHQDGASLAQHSQAFEQAQKDTAPRKINVTSKSPVGDISVVTLIRTDTTLDHSQKAEKVYSAAGGDQRTKQKQQAASTLGLGGVNAQTGPLVFKSFQCHSLAKQTHDHRGWG